MDILDWLIRGSGAQSDCKKIVSYTAMANERLQFTYLYIYIYISVYEHMCIIKFIVLMCLNLQVQRLYFIVRNSYEVSVLRIKIALAEHDTSL